MRSRRLLGTLLLAVVLTGCAKEGPGPDAADAPPTRADLAERPLTPEVTEFSGEALTPEEYRRRVNEACAQGKADAARNPPPDDSDEAAVVAWTIGLLDISTQTYRTLASLRPPAEQEAEVRAGFLDPYHRQLSAGERLYVELAAGNPARRDELLAEAQQAERELSAWAADNELTECVG